ncbi:MAG: hypothetical protein KTR32_01090 [Granulosicoccus sp.]|nr:hypothetical protein [Granulosicoccus sp.]
MLLRIKSAVPVIFILTLAVTATPAHSEISFSSTELSLLQRFGPWPVSTPPDPGNELSGKVWAEHLGRRLFHDTDLSAERNLSCASCHRESQKFTDGLALAQGRKRHVRNTQGLLDSGLQRWFGWDGGTDSLWSAAMRPLLSDIEMGNSIDSLARRLRGKTYFVQSLEESGKGEKIETIPDEDLVVLAAKAIAAYNRTLVSGRTAFDQFRDHLNRGYAADQSDYPEAAQRGLKLFLGEANCHLCHFGPNFSNAEFHDTGRPFFTGVGQVDGGRYEGIKRVRKDRYNLLGPYSHNPAADATRKVETVTLGQVNFGQWRTPSLRNLRYTAPYTHDGSLKTLRDVVDFYADIDPARLHSKGESILKPLDMTEQDRQDLVRFLESLSE